MIIGVVIEKLRKAWVFDENLLTQNYILWRILILHPNWNSLNNQGYFNFTSTAPTCPTLPSVWYCWCACSNVVFHTLVKCCT